MYTRSDDDILPARRRRGDRRVRPAAGRPPSPPAPSGRRVAAPAPGAPAARPLDAATLLEPFAPPPPGVAPAGRAGHRRAGRGPAAVVGEVLLTLTAVLGLAMMSLTVVAVRSGMRPLVVRSGSMEPTIPTGSMVLVQRVAAADIAVGDVVAVVRPDRTRVTHRVVDLERRGEAVELTLKGDANEDNDPQPVTVRSAHRLVRHVPWVGRAAAWLASAPGGFAVGCVLTAATMVALRRRRSADG